MGALFIFRWPTIGEEDSFQRTGMQAAAAFSSKSMWVIWLAQSLSLNLPIGPEVAPGVGIPKNGGITSPPVSYILRKKDTRLLVPFLSVC